MAVFDNTFRTIESVADEYVRTLMSGEAPIVMSRAIKSVRMVIPDLQHPDDHIANVIALRAAARGLPIEFD